MLLQEEQQSLAHSSGQSQQKRWRFLIEDVTEDDISDLIDATLLAFLDDSMVKGCFDPETDPEVRRQQEKRWRVSSTSTRKTRSHPRSVAQ